MMRETVIALFAVVIFAAFMWAVTALIRRYRKPAPEAVHSRVRAMSGKQAERPKKNKLF
ncbi:MAG: hypothetical protein ACI4LA_08105 [Emergencia sp.]